MRKNTKSFFIYLLVTAWNFSFGAQHQRDKKRKAGPMIPVNRQLKNNKIDAQLFSFSIPPTKPIEDPVLAMQVCRDRLQLLLKSHLFADVKGVAAQCLDFAATGPEFPPMSPHQQLQRLVKPPFPQDPISDPASAKQIFDQRLKFVLMSPLFDAVRPISDCYLKRLAVAQAEQPKIFSIAPSLGQAKESADDDVLMSVVSPKELSVASVPLSPAEPEDQSGEQHKCLRGLDQQLEVVANGLEQEPQKNEMPIAPQELSVLYDRVAAHQAQLKQHNGQ